MARSAKRSSKSAASDKTPLPVRGLNRVAAAGLRRGARGSKPWLYLGVVASGVRVLRWLTRPKPVVVSRAVLEPGESLEIITRAPER